MVIIIVGSFSENSFVIGSNKVPTTSNTIAPNKDRYPSIVTVSINPFKYPKSKPCADYGFECLR